LRRDELYVEGLLCNDAAKIIIDEEFKNDLKNKIMFGDKCNNITELPKRKNNFKQNRYLKIASGFVICVFVSGAIFNNIDIPNKSIAIKGDTNAELIMPLATNKGLSETTVNKTQDPQNKSVKADSGSGNKQVVVETNSENKTPNSPSVKTGETNPAKVNTNNGNSSESDDEINALETYAENLGIAFQIEDDILDVEGTAEKLGKPIGSDEANNKKTYLSFVNINEARKHVQKFTDEAIKSLNIFGDKAINLTQLAKYLTNRDH